MAGANPIISDPGYTVTPVSQTVGRGLLATFRIALTSGRLASQQLTFDITDSSGGGGSLVYPSGSNPATINNGSNFVDFQASSQTQGTYTLSVSPRAGSTDGTLSGPVTATLIVWLLRVRCHARHADGRGGRCSGSCHHAPQQRGRAQGGFAFGLATSASSGGSFSSGASVTLAAGQNSVSTSYTGTTPETDTLTITPPAGNVVNPAAKTAQVTVSSPTSVDYSVSMPTTGTTGQAYPVTITLLNGAVAPSGGYAFALSTSSGANGSFGMASVGMQAGQNSLSTNYTGTVAETDTISVTAASPLTTNVHSAQIVLSSPQPGNPGFVWSPSSLSALTGQACGPYTLSLTGGAVAPAGGLLFALASDETDGGSFSTGNSLALPAGQNSVQTSYTGASAGTYHLTATPPSAGRRRSRADGAGGHQ